MPPRRLEALAPLLPFCFVLALTRACRTALLSICGYLARTYL